MHDRLLDDFLDAFSSALSEVSPTHLADVWHVGGTRRRTALYADLLGQVATALGPEWVVKKEHCRIDFVLGKTIPLPGAKHDGIVPLIAVESENMAPGASNEVDNLCALAAPVKVLITCAIWSRTPPSQDARERLLDRWRSIHAAHVAALPERAKDVFVVIVGERTRKGSTQRLRFFKEVLAGPGADSSTLVDLVPPIDLP